jgi:hypothetical protein
LRGSLFSSSYAAQLIAERHFYLCGAEVGGRPFSDNFWVMGTSLPSTLSSIRHRIFHRDHAS